jgi:uncharacterized glyoxalase superfamily protein PhnB
MKSAVAALIAAGGLLCGEQVVSGGSMVSTAEARVGRPLTPMSYAGVARRTTRRAVGAGAVAAGAAGAYAYGARCVHVRDAYGHVVTRCP